MKKPRSYVVLAVLASGTLYFAISLSASGRTLIDWTVLVLAVADTIALIREEHVAMGPPAAETAES